MGPLGDPATLVDLAVRAEAAGWDGVFLWDHVLTEFPPIADTWTTLGAIAGATRTIRLGPMVTPLPRRRPWVVARQASTVSRLRVVASCSAAVSAPTRPATSRVSARRHRWPSARRCSTRGSAWSGRCGQGRRTATTDLTTTSRSGTQIPSRIAYPSGWPARTRAAPCSREPRSATASTSTRTATKRLPKKWPALLEGLRGAGLPADAAFDVAVRGNASSAWPDPEPKNVDLAGLADAGATWWMEALIYFDPLDMSLDVVDAGPPGV